MKFKTYNIFFSKFANPLRIKIISSLDKKPKSVTQLSDKLKVEQSRISHALRELRKCSIVQVEQKGKKRIYNLNKETILPILRIIDKHRNKYCKIKGK